MQLKVSGKGNDAPANGIPGDLLVAIEEKPHETLQREGDNLHYDLYISISEAVLGTSREIETVTGKVRIKIESGVQSGKILRLRNKGIPSINGYGTGDLLVHINVWTPKSLSKEQRDFFEVLGTYIKGFRVTFRQMLSTGCSRSGRIFADWPCRVCRSDLRGWRGQILSLTTCSR